MGLQQNSFGITIQKLERDINAQLGFEVNYSIFNNSQTFYDFLLAYIEDMVDIEVKRNMTLIYPKNQRFGYEIFAIQKNSQISHNKSPSFTSNYSQIFDYDFKTPNSKAGGHAHNHSNITISPIIFYGHDSESEEEKDDEEVTQNISKLPSIIHSRQH